jgi:arylsulfatase A-like enzyme
MDTVRFDRTSLGGDRDTTPNLAALAAEGTSWSRAFSVGNESLFSHAALFTGRYPSEIAPPDYQRFAIPKGEATLASALKAYGYDTAAFTGGGHVVAAFGFDAGFDEWNEAPGEMSFGSFYDSVPDALAYMRGHGERPWFVFVHGYDAHSPYAQPGPFGHQWSPEAAPTREALLSDPLALEQLRGDLYFPDRSPTDFVHAAGRTMLSTDFYRLPATPAPGERTETLSPAEIQHLRDHYDNGVSYADHWLGVLLSEVNLDDTLVIVVSDHGEDLLDHGFVNHRAGLWDSTLHVPLVAAGPGIPVGGKEDGLVDLRSVSPTLLLAAGAEVPSGAVAPALQTKPAAEAVFAEGVMDMISVRDARGRLCLSAVGALNGAPELASRPLGGGDFSYFLEPSPADQLSDRGVQQNANDLRGRLLQWRSGLRTAGPSADAPGRAALLERLKGEGYFTPGAPPPPGQAPPLPPLAPGQRPPTPTAPLGPPGPAAPPPQRGG